MAQRCCPTPLINSPASQQRTHRVEAVESAIERVYAERQMSKEQRAEVIATVKSQAEAMMLLAGEKVAESELRLTQLDRQERKHLMAHYDDKISEELFAEEQGRIRRERIAAKRRIDTLGVDHDKTVKTLDKALDLLGGETGTAYLLAQPEERRALNQGLYKGFKIENEEVVAEVAADPFAELRELGEGWNGSHSQAEKQNSRPSEENREFENRSLVPLRGFEPRFPD